ncbi:hypothetical protein QP519_11070 [Weeksella virosa]|uniref:hypothetical protein n=1 Tax=Weeksella virosa TaxID=1014 RepID=UPI00255524DA|nr:hypothetical protein [Weeksella virosa]MDK7376072.1 hypothetical protein [Weeksella virosa]
MSNIFKNNPNLNVYYKTADGQAFYLFSDARNHAKTLGDKDVEAVTRVVSDEKDVREYAMNAKDSISAIKEASTVEELVAFADDERKSVKEAYGKKLAELSVEDNPNETDDEAED